MDVAALIVSGIAVVIAGWALFYSRKTANASRDSARAAERSAATAERADARAEQQADVNRVVFSLTRLNKHHYKLSNDGTDTAYGVTIDPRDSGYEGPGAFEKFPGGHEEMVMVLPSFDSSGDSITVTWHYNEERSDPASSKTLLISP